MKKLFGVFALMMAFAVPAQAGDREDILNVVERFFDALRDRDPDVWDEILLDEGQITAHREQADGSWILSPKNNREQIDRLETDKGYVDERIWDPTVLVHKTMAVVWAPYDVFVEGELIHCGVDMFELFKIEGQWKINHTSYTAEPEGCADLGQPERD
ncbi:MAG: hypothetical protein ACTSU8_01750 [Alphaproteobacteria bacterium]